MAGKYKPGETRRIAMSRIRIPMESRYLLKPVPNEVMRKLVQTCGKTRSKKQDWYLDIPPIEARYVPKYSTHQFVLVGGGESYMKAQQLGLDTILCTIIDENKELPYDISSWFDLAES